MTIPIDSGADTPPNGTSGAESKDINYERRWLILGIAAIAQLLVIMDSSIMNVALAAAQRDLGFSDVNRQWVITAYALAAGSLLLLGGRASDLFGRKQIFLIGLIGFAIASVIGGAAPNFEVLVAARAIQGISSALLAPAALAIVAVTFTEPTERAKALSIFGAVAGVGAGIGLLLGGVLTDLLSWRWGLYVNIVLAVPAFVVGARMIKAHHRDRKTGGHTRTLDLPGAFTVTGGVFALVFGVSRAETHGWDDVTTISSLIVSVVLLVAFVIIERRVREPLLPLRVVSNTTRGGSYFAIAIYAIVLFSMYLFVPFYLQHSLGYSPLKTGLAVIPSNLALVVTVANAPKLLARFGPRPLITVGLLISAAGDVVLAQIGAGSGYLSLALPGLVLIGIGGGFLFATTFATGTFGIEERDTGVASAILNVALQLGGSIGIAILSTVFGTAVSNYLTEHGAEAANGAPIHGYSVVYWVAAGTAFAGAIISALLIRAQKHQLAAAATVPMH